MKLSKVRDILIIIVSSILLIYLLIIAFIAIYQFFVINSSFKEQKLARMEYITNDSLLIKQCKQSGYYNLMLNASSMDSFIIYQHQFDKWLDAHPSNKPKNNYQ